MRRSSYQQTASPVLDPVDVCDVKSFLDIEFDDDDAQIAGHIKAATRYVQEYQWSQLITATWVQKMDDFPEVIELNPNPVQSVTSVAYVDTGGTSQTLVANTDYVVDTSRRPALIYPAYNQYWPDVRLFENDVTVTFVAGYGDTHESVPFTTKQAILSMVKMLYDGCDPGELPWTLRALLDADSFRVPV